MTLSGDSKTGNGIQGDNRPQEEPIGYQTPIMLLVRYDEQWPARFEAESGLISEALGIANSVILHIGSTSIPNFSAKPIIDIIAAVSKLEPWESYAARLERLGYSYRDVRDPDRIFFEKMKPHRYHIHIVETDSWQYWRLQLFRDCLRNDADLQRRYLELKRKLAFMYPHDRDSYSRGKTQFVNETVRQELLVRRELVRRFPEAQVLVSPAPISA